MIIKPKFTVLVFALWIFGMFFGSAAVGVDLFYNVTKITWWGLLGGIFFYLLAIFCGVLALYISLSYVGVKTKSKGIIKGWIFGSFIDNISPTITPLGEVTIIWFLNRFYGVFYYIGLAAIGIYVAAWGIASTIIAAASFLVAFLFLNVPITYQIFSLIIVLIFGGLSTSAIILVRNEKVIKPIAISASKLFYRIRNKLTGKNKPYDEEKTLSRFQKFHESFGMLIKNKRLLVTVITILVINQLCHVLGAYVIFLGLGVDIDIMVILFVHMTSMVTGLLLLVPGGMGIYSVVSGGLYVGLFGIDESIAVTGVIIYRIIFLWGTNLLGMIVGMTEGIKEQHIEEISVSD